MYENRKKRSKGVGVVGGAGERKEGKGKMMRNGKNGNKVFVNREGWRG